MLKQTNFSLKFKNAISTSSNYCTWIYLALGKYPVRKGMTMIFRDLLGFR